MGFLDLQSFCCGLANLQLGCKIISLATAVYSFAVFAVGVSYNDLLIAGAAYILLFFALLLLYGVLERVKVLLLLFLFLRALTVALELADIMRSLGMGASSPRDVVRVVLETIDFMMSLYFWLVVFSFCINPDSFALPSYGYGATMGMGVGGGGGGMGVRGGGNSSTSNLFPNVPHYPPVPDEDRIPGGAAVIPRSRRGSLVGYGQQPQQQQQQRHHRLEDSASSPYNLVHQGRVGGGPTSPSTSSSEVFTYSGMPVSKATPLSPHHSSPRSPRSPRHSIGEQGTPSSPPSSSHHGGHHHQSRARARSPRPGQRPRAHPRAENLKYHREGGGGGAGGGGTAQTNPFL